jgi:uncharacterized protein
MTDQTLIPQKKPKNIILVIGIIAALLLPFALSFALGPTKISHFDKAFYSRFIYWGTVLFLFFYAYKIEKQPLLIWPENNPGIGFFLQSVVVLYILYIGALIVSATPVFFGYHEKNEMMKKVVQLLKGHPVFTFFVALTAGVTEELIFRGYLLTRLSQLFKMPYIPVIASSLLFSAMHYNYHSLHECIFAFLIGIIFSIYYLKYRNIKAIMLTHFLIDYITLVLAEHFYK